MKKTNYFIQYYYKKWIDHGEGSTKKSDALRTFTYLNTSGSNYKYRVIKRVSTTQETVIT